MNSQRFMLNHGSDKRIEREGGISVIVPVTNLYVELEM